MKRTGVALIGALAALAAIAPAAQGRDAVVESFDGTPIVTHFFPAPNATAQSPAPTIMIGHGWGGSGATSPQSNYANAGYNVLTWDARGFGGSGGSVMIDHPDFEAKDASALIDFIAQQPEAKLDSPGDPLLGMDGPSYGGGIQLITASQDQRVDAITPTIAWNKLTTSLYKANSLKLGWDLALVGLGIPTSLLPGIFSPAGVQTGHQSPQFYDLVTSGVSTGRLSQSGVEWLEEHGPDRLLSGLHAPTMIVQGTADTLFTLDEAHRNFTQLKAQGTPVKMMWFCGGHGVCLTGSDNGGGLGGITGDGGRVGERKLAWFDRWLNGNRSAATGPEFEWIDEEGTWHESGDYPQTPTGTASGSGSGTLALVPGVVPPLPLSGLLIFATPAAAGGVNVPIESPPAGSQVVGAPQVSLTYTATGASLAGDGKTHVFAQLVDKDRNLVVNNQATPIPIELDGAEHQVTVPLERVASLSTEAGYELQIIPQTTMYDIQRATGAVQIADATVELPLTSPTPTRGNVGQDEGGPAGDAPKPSPGNGAKKCKAAKKKKGKAGAKGKKRKPRAKCGKKKRKRAKRK